MISTAKHSYKIQVIRGVLIISVVLLHCLPPGICQVFLRPFVNFSVGTFLFLSGLLSDIKKWNPKKRIIKILIPYFIWTLVYTIINYNKNPENIPLKYFIGLLTTNSEANMYYIFVYLQLTILLPIINKISNMKYGKFFLVISFLEIILVRTLPMHGIYRINRYIELISNISFLPWFTYFYLGYLINLGIININIKIEKIYLFLVFFIILQMIEGYILHISGNVNSGTQFKISSLITGLIFCILIYKMIFSDKIIKNFYLKYLGDNSFAIYFIHIVFIKVLKNVERLKYVSIFPINIFFVIIFSLLGITIIRKILGNNSKYLAIY